MHEQLRTGLRPPMLGGFSKVEGVRRGLCYADLKGVAGFKV